MPEENDETSKIILMQQLNMFKWHFEYLLVHNLTNMQKHYRICFIGIPAIFRNSPCVRESSKIDV